MPDEKGYEDMLFFNETSYRTEFRSGEIKRKIKTVYEAKPSCYRIRPPPLRDIHTLFDWKDARVPPFNLFHRLKDIVRTNPWEGQKPYEKENTEEVRKQVQKTRPRLVMTPAASVDDIKDPVARKNLCTETYISATGRFMREVAALPPRVNVKAPLPALPAPANPITLSKLQPPLVAPEWRMESAAWDSRQLRARCDQTAEFWLRRDPAKCTKCDETLLVRTLGKTLTK